MISRSAVCQARRRSIETFGDARKLVLDTNELVINRVTLDDGDETTFVLGSALTIAIRPETKLVKIEYATSLDAAAMQWLSPEQTAGKHIRSSSRNRSGFWRDRGCRFRTRPACG
ncbi:MAG TPA: hypothetical protein VGQ76_00070 [Thermoanaerobaculia bacterium]|nr:hypothetical protein [Thermoanaerobaculia bacterium]